MIQLVIFDLDGTLLNSIDDIAISTNHALRKFGYPEHPREAYRHFVGSGITKLIEKALPATTKTSDTIFQVRTAFLEYYLQHPTDFTHPYSGIPELLKQLRQQGILLAVASNKFHQGTIELTHHFFGNYFQVILGQKEGIPIKPDPTIVQQILQTTGISRHNTLYVGDTNVDMLTAKNSQVTSAGVTWGFRSRQELEEAGADLIVDYPEQLGQWILQQNLQIN